MGMSIQSQRHFASDKDVAERATVPDGVPVGGHTMIVPVLEEKVWVWVSQLPAV